MPNPKLTLVLAIAKNGVIGRDGGLPWRLSSDLKRTITPCQYGGTPDCTQCGCMASVGLGALGDYKLGGLMPLRSIFNASFRIGDGMRKLRGEASR